MRLSVLAVRLLVVVPLGLAYAADDSVGGQPSPITRLKSIHARTVLREAGKLQCVIVSTPGDSLTQSAAQLQDALRTADGTCPEILLASEIVDASWGIDFGAIGDRTIIALGNVNTNRLLAVLYGQRYVVADSLYPGTEGHVIRTVHDPFARGINVLVLAGSDAAGVERACSEFVRKYVAGRTGPLVLPEPVIDVVFTPESRPFFPECTHSLSSKRQPQYTGLDWFRESWRKAGVMDDEGNVTAARDPAAARSLITGLLARMGQTFFRTGNRELIPLMKELIVKNRSLLANADSLHGMGGRTAGHVMQWDLLEELSVWTDQERLDITNALLADAAIGHERRAFHKQVKEGAVQALDENHGTFSALRSFQAWHYFDKYYDIPESTYWLACADAVFSAQAGTFQILEDASGYLCYCPMSSMDYALRRGNLKYFERGIAQQHARMISLACINNLGLNTGFGDSSGLVMPEVFETLAPAAWYYRDPNLYWILQNVLPMNCGLRIFQKSIALDLSVPPQEPVDWTGLIKIPIYRTPLQKGEATRQAVFAPREIVDDTLFNKIVFKENWDRDGHYLLLDGAGVWGGPPGPHGHKHNDINTIVNFTALGRMWLVDHTYQVRQHQHHSSVHVTIDGKGGYRKRTLARVVDLADFADHSVSRTSFMDGERTIVWTKGRHFLIIDKVVAKTAGEFFARNSLRTLGKHELRGNDLFLEQDGRYCKILTDGIGQADVETYAFTNSHWGTFYPHAEPVVKVFQRDRRRTMAPGDAFGFASLLVPYSNPENEDDVSLKSLSETCALVCEGDDWLVVGLGEIPGTADTAGVFLVEDRSIAAIGARVMCGGILRTDFPGDMRIDLVDETVTVDVGVDTELTLVGVAKAVYENDRSLKLRRSAHENHLPVSAGKHVFTLREWSGFARVRAAILSTKAAAERTVAAKVAEMETTTEATVPDVHGVTIETVQLGMSLRTLRVVDLDGNGTDEWLVTGDDGIALFSPAGGRIWQHATAAAVRTVDVGDVDGDGETDIVAGCDDHRIYLLDRRGRLKWTFNCKPSQGSTDGPPAVDWVTITDLEGDGSKEIVAGANWVHVLSPDGGLRWERYMDLRRGRICGDFSCGAVADVDGDGIKEIAALFVTSYPLLQVLDAQGDMAVPVGTGKGHRGVNIGVPVATAVLELDPDSRQQQIVCATESDLRMAWHDHRQREDMQGRLAKPCVAMASKQNGPANAPLLVVATPLCEVIAATAKASLGERQIRTTQLWRRNVGEKVTCLHVPDATASGMAAAVAVGTKTGSIVLLDAGTGVPRGHVRLHGASVAAIVGAGVPGQMMAGLADGTVVVFRAPGERRP